MLFSGADLIRMGALQAERVTRLDLRARVITAVNIAGDGGGSPNPQPRPRRRQTIFPEPQKTTYGRAQIPKKGEILDIFA